MWNQIIGKLSQVVSRRGLLGRAASGSAAVVLAICGFALPSSGSRCGTLVPCLCCCVCSSTLCNSNYSKCVGTWCWTCNWKNHPIGTCHIVYCIECYKGDCTTFNDLDTCPGDLAPCGCKNANVPCADCIDSGISC